VRSAGPNKSFGALPADLKEFVSSRGLTALRDVLPVDVQERVACIKRREQNQRALETRRAAREQQVNRIRAELDAARLQCRWMTTHAEVMAEYEEHVAQQDGTELFRPEARVGYLYGSIHARPVKRSDRVRGGGPGGNDLKPDDDALFDCDLSFLGGSVPIETVGTVAGTGDAAGLPASDDL